MTEVITVTPIQKPARLNRAQRRALARETLTHRKRFCPHRCDTCGDYIPRHYCNRIKNPRLKAERKRARSSGLPPLKFITECYDCYTVRRESDRTAYQRWCATHRLHALDRMLRLMAWCGVEVDTAMAWRRFSALGGPAKIEAMREIEECTAGMIDDYREIAEPHPFADAMDEMAALELRPPMERPEDDATDATVEIEVEVFKLTGETEIVLNDSGWRKLHNAVLYYLNAYQRLTPENN